MYASLFANLYASLYAFLRANLYASLLADLNASLFSFLDANRDAVIDPESLNLLDYVATHVVLLVFYVQIKIDMGFQKITDLYGQILWRVAMQVSLERGRFV